jgi:hypothetical protein
MDAEAPLHVLFAADQNYTILYCLYVEGYPIYKQHGKLLCFKSYTRAVQLIYCCPGVSLDGIATVHE